MPAFSITPAGPFPSPSGSGTDFPNFIQWQQDGTNLGAPTVDTVNLTGSVTATRGTGEDSGVLTVDVTGGGTPATPAVLVVVLANGSPVPLDGIDFDAWLGTTTVTSTDAEWDDVNGITFVAAGVYEIALGIQATPSGGPLPDDGTFYGSYVPPADVSFARSTYGITKLLSQMYALQRLAWSDTFTVVATAGQQFKPVAYADNYNHPSDLVEFRGVLTVRKVS